jgi:hypothetical protein
MPYVDTKARERLATSPKMETPGELNYRLTRVINDYLEYHLACYTTFNDVVGALESAKLEFYRRIVVPYEQIKCAQNGDVYD